MGRPFGFTFGYLPAVASYAPHDCPNTPMEVAIADVAGRLTPVGQDLQAPLAPRANTHRLRARTGFSHPRDYLAPKGYDKAKEIEDTWNGRLAEALKARGFPSARFSPQYEVIVQGKKTTRKPDLDFKDGGTHIISGKYGQVREILAISTAVQYQADLAPHVEDLAEVFAVVYPDPGKKGEKFRLHVLPSKGHPGEMGFAADTLDELADRIALIVQGRIAELAREPLREEAPRLLLNGATLLAHALREVPQADLESIFGGHDFFVSVLQPRLKDGKKRREALQMGAAYLFTNQLLFYVLLSRAAELAGNPHKYPKILPEHARSPKKVRDLYFEKVRDINYEPIYGFDVAQYLTGKGAEEACHDLVMALQVLAPNLDQSDLVGQIFQTLIPFDIRKPLGAHFTNPRAAKLLARLAIDDPEVTVLDPACGSGTLLVAAYHRKEELSHRDPEELHKLFVEEQITGMDAMAFSAHLAVVNLASQKPLQETEHVRLATTDSTVRKPGDVIPAAQEALPHEFLQAKLIDDFRKTGKKKAGGAVRASRKKEATVEMRPVKLVIMNPPFTSWDNMGPIYRENMKKRFQMEKAAYRDVLFWKISQQAFFFLLADRFLEPGGRIAAVTPFTTFTGRAFHKFVDWFIKSYTVEYVVVGLGRCSYSEDTSLTECLVVARKGAPPEGHRFRVVGTQTDPAKRTDDEIDQMAEAIERGETLPGMVVVDEVEQKELSQKGRTLTDIMLSLLPGYRRARETLAKVLAVR